MYKKKWFAEKNVIYMVKREETKQISQKEEENRGNNQIERREIMQVDEPS